VYLIFGTVCRRSVALAMRLWTVPCIYIYIYMYTRFLSRIRSGDEGVDFLNCKLVKAKQEQLHAYLATSHGKKISSNYECTVHCSNI